ncbi:hypothetical protein B0H14DRAFT_1675715 [Mycena olivaceomarginata]|nr:hypothetical protein B0H14DRAFT_1675715 [Mycena olivaceomarginata]
MGTPKKTSKKLQSQLRPRTTRSSKARLLSDPMENTALLTEQLRSLGLYAAPTIGDGNCLFRALSDQLYGSPSRHPQLRREVCDWIAGHKARYEPFVEDERGIEVHLRCMRENATYGGHMELSAFAHLTRRNVKVIQPGLVYVIEWAAGEGASPTTSAPPGLSHSSSSSSLSSLSSLAPSAGASPAPGAAPAPSSSLSLAASGSAAALASALAGASASGSRRPDGVEVIDVDAGEGGGAGGAQVEEGTIYVAYHDWEHFSSIRNLKGPHTGLPAVRETPPYPYPSSPTSSEHADPNPKQSKADAKERKRMEAEAKERKRVEREAQRKGKPPSARDETKQEGKVLPKVRLKLSSASPTKPVVAVAAAVGVAPQVGVGAGAGARRARGEWERGDESAGAAEPEAEL